MRVSTSGLRQDSPAKPLLLALISYQGITDAAGAATGLTIVDGGLVNESSYDGQLLKIRSGPAAGQVKPIYVQAGNTLTFATPWTNAAGAVQQIAAGTLFDILSISGGGGGPGPAPKEGLSYYGVVDAIPGANQFTIGSLAGLGAGKFDGATNPYWVFVLRDAGGAGAAPQGEQLQITAYATATGTFTTGAFTAAVAVGDEILILHPDVANVLVILAGLAVPAIDSVVNLLMRDVVGNKADTPDYTAGVLTSSLVRLVKGILGVTVIAEGTLDTSSPTVPADSTRAEGNDFFKGCILMPVAGAIAFQPRPIRQFAAGTGVFTLDEPFTVAPGLVAYVVLASDYPVQRLIDIFNLVNAMLVTTETGGTITTDGTVQDVYINNAPAGVFEPLKVMVDLSGMTVAETVVIRTYYRIRPGPAIMKQKDEVVFQGVQGLPLKNIELEPNRYGIQVTLECTVGGPIDIPWEVLYRV
jgi:hypothetical protein